MPTLRTRYFRTDSSSGGTGTEDRIDGANRAYESLNAALGAERTADRFLTTNDEILHLICTQPGADTTRVLWPGSASTPFVTDAQRYVFIECQGAAHHRGVQTARTGSGYRLDLSGVDPAIWRYTAYIRTKGLEMTKSDLFGGGILTCTQSPSDGHYLFEECIWTSSHGTDAGGTGLVGGGGGVVLTLRNCLIVSDQVRNFSATSQHVHISHCGFLSNHDNQNVMIAEGSRAENSWSFGATGGGQDWWTGGTSPSGSHNASSDTTATTDFTDSLASRTPSNELINSSLTLSACNAQLAEGSTLIGAGTGNYPTDIKGAARSGAPDIGPYDFATHTSLGSIILNP